MPDPIDIGLVDPVIKQRLSNPFPQIPAPFVDPATGVINQIWLQLLIALWERTGGASGGGGSTTDIFNYVVGEPSLAPPRENAEAGELGLLGQPPSASMIIAIKEEIARQLLLVSKPPVIDPLMALLFSTHSAPASGDASDCCASWVPLVDGAEPPGFITDGAGNLVFIAFGP